MFHIILRKGKYIGSNLKLSLNSVVESAKPNLVFIYQSSLGMLVRKLRSFLRCPQFFVGEERRKSHLQDLSLGIPQAQHVCLNFLVSEKNHLLKMFCSLHIYSLFYFFKFNPIAYERTLGICKNHMFSFFIGYLGNKIIPNQNYETKAY